MPSRLASGAARAVRTVAPAKLARLGGKFGKVAGPVGLGLTFINITIEANTNTWDAHTFVDGAMLVVTAAGLVLAGVAASPALAVVGAVIVVYGILDYAFDIGEKVIDPAIGRKSGLWD